jgi:hypothetical protein
MATFKDKKNEMMRVEERDAKAKADAEREGDAAVEAAPTAEPPPKPVPTYYCSYCNITIRKSYKSQHENTMKHRGAFKRDPRVQEQRKKYLEEKQEQNECLISILQKLTVSDKRFILENQRIFLDGVKVAYNI